MTTLQDLKNLVNDLIDKGVDLDTPIKTDYRTDIKSINLYEMDYTGYKYIQIEIEE